MRNLKTLFTGLFVSTIALISPAFSDGTQSSLQQKTQAERSYIKEIAKGQVAKNVELTESNFQKEVLDADTPVMVMVTASWCKPCKLLKKNIQAVENVYATGVKFGHVDFDHERKLVQGLEVGSVPTLIFYKNGKVVEKSVGLISQEELSSKLDSLVATP